MNVYRIYTHGMTSYSGKWKGQDQHGLFILNSSESEHLYGILNLKWPLRTNRVMEFIAYRPKPIDHQNI